MVDNRVFEMERGTLYWPSAPSSFPKAKTKRAKISFPKAISTIIFPIFVSRAGKSSEGAPLAQLEDVSASEKASKTKMLRVREIAKSIFDSTHTLDTTQSHGSSCGSYYLPSQDRDSRSGNRAEVEHQLEPERRGLENLDT